MDIETHKKKIIAGAVLAGIFIAGALVFSWYTAKESVVSGTDVSRVTEEQNKNSDLSGIEIGESINNGEYTIERLPDAPGIVDATLNLKRTIPETSADISGSARTQAIANMNVLIAQLEVDRGNFNALLQLGVYRTILGDYTGAEEVWVYITKKYPSDWQAFQNLGSLYMTYIPNVTKAESNIKQAITLRKDNEELYRTLYQLYVQQKKSVEAIATLKQGIEAIPKAVDLVVLLAREYRSQGKDDLAKTQYDVAVGRAQASGNTALALELETEKATLQ